MNTKNEFSEPYFDGELWCVKVETTTVTETEIRTETKEELAEVVDRLFKSPPVSKGLI